MILKIQDVLDFRTDSSKIKSDTVTPINAYLKIQPRQNYCTFSKNGSTAFIKKNIPAECTPTDPVILVEEAALFDIVENSKADTVQIINTDKGVKIITGERKALAAVPDNPNLFNEHTDFPGNWDKIFVEAISSIGIAANFIEEHEDTKAPATVYIFCRGKHIIGCNGFIGYIKLLNDPCPEIIVTKEIASIICNFPGAEYASNASYQFFKAGSLLYGFGKTEVNFFDMSSFANVVFDDTKFSILKDDLIAFNNICIRRTKSKLVRSVFKSQSNTKLEAIFEEPDSGIYSLVDYIDANGMANEFKYDPFAMNRLLKALPASALFFYPGKNRYYITDEHKNFISFIMGTI